MTLKQEEKNEGVRAFLWEIAQFVVLALIIVVPIRTYIAQPYIVSGSSMHPAFENGDYLIVDQLTYRFKKPEHGDVIIFRYPNDPSKFFIKRIIGTPGDTLNLHNGVITITNSVYPDGITFEESYIAFPLNEEITATLNEDEYFVLGDNRLASLDSRSWGPLEERLIVGRVLVRLFPVTKIGSFPGKLSPLEMPI